MSALKELYRVLFGFPSYRKGLIIHLLLFASYTALSIGIHYVLLQSVVNPDVSLYYRRLLGKYLVLVMCLHLLSLFLLRRRQSLQLALEYFSEKGSAYNLAIFRIVFFFILAGHFTFYTFEKEISWTYLPHSSRVALPYLGWIIEHLPITPGIYTTCSILAAIFSFLVCIGLFTRFAALLLLPFALYILGVPMFFGKLNHHHILLWIPVLFCLSPMADVWSVDALLKKRAVKPDTGYMLPFKFLWLQLAVIYVFAGIIKLWDCGLDWALGDNMINQMRWEWVEQYDRVPGFRLDNYPVLAKLGGLSVIVFELLYFLLILKPSGRIWAFFGAYALHKLAGYFMYIDFVTLRVVAICYIDWHRLLNYFGVKLRYNARPDLTMEDPAASGHAAFSRYRPLLLTGSVLVGLNFLCSAFSIHSYPFSSYPTYSSMAPDRISLLRMEAFTADNKRVDVKRLGNLQHFRWETIRPYEIRIADSYERRDTTLLRARLNEYWLLWKNNVKGLEHVRKVNMYLEKTPLAPEQRNVILSSDSVGTIYP